MTPITYSFDAVTVGTLPSGLTNAAIVGTAAGNFQVVAVATGTSVRSLRDMAATDGGGTGLLVSGMTAVADHAIQVDQVVQIDGAGRGGQVTPVLRSDSAAQSSYIITYDFTSSNNNVGGPNGGYIFKRVAGSSPSSVGTIPALSSAIANGTAVSIYAQIQGSTISVWIWPTAQAKPTTPLATITDSSITAAGIAGLFSESNAGALDGSLPTLARLYVGDPAATFPTPTTPTPTTPTPTTPTTPTPTTPTTPTPTTPTPTTPTTPTPTPTSTLAVAQNLSDVTVVSATSASVSVATPTGGSGNYSYAWYLSSVANFTPSSSTLYPGQTGPTATFSGLAPSAPLWVVCVVSDGTTSITTFHRLVEISGLAPLRVLVIGDSTEAVNTLSFPAVINGTPGPPSRHFKSILQAISGPRQVTVIDQAIAGTSSGDWAAGGQNLTAAIATARGAGFVAGDWCRVRLGVNDAQGKVAAATYQTNIAGTVAALVAAGWNVQLDYPTWREPGVFFENTSLTFDESTTPYLVQYAAILDAMVNGSTIYAGDKTSFLASASSPTYYLNRSTADPGGIHETVDGAVSMGAASALALLRNSGVLAAQGSAGPGAILSPAQAAALGQVPTLITNVTHLITTLGITFGSGTVTNLVGVPSTTTFATIGTNPNGKVNFGRGQQILFQSGINNEERQVVLGSTYIPATANTPGITVYTTAAFLDPPGDNDEFVLA